MTPADTFLSGNIDVFVGYLKLRFPLENGKMHSICTLVRKMKDYRKDILNRKLLSDEEVCRIKELMRRQ